MSHSLFRHQSATAATGSSGAAGDAGSGLAGRLAAPVIPVIVLHDAADAVPLARALVAGGLPVLEVTLRTPAGIEAIRRIAAEVPAAQVGAGTVTRPAEMREVRLAGARFAFSPGWAPGLSAAARDQGLGFVPGVMTPSEAMDAAAHGHRELKLFPAAVAGGPAMLRALAGPLPDLRFCPTGGVTPENIGEYLALANVFAVGGTWLTPADAVAARDWQRITALAARAASARG
jgi:2-dehydro-3-deoxyphosphogluconate aldolase/(4S)-4-hydroxy-2-oxoglutarate aldolase